MTFSRVEDVRGHKIDCRWRNQLCRRAQVYFAVLAISENDKPASAEIGQHVLDPAKRHHRSQAQR